MQFVCAKCVTNHRWVGGGGYGATHESLPSTHFPLGVCLKAIRDSDVIQKRFLFIVVAAK